MIEMFDVVDKKDYPTGALTTKTESDATGILHRCVAVFVFDKQGRLYIQNHKKTGLLDHSVGGHVKSGEDYAAAAIREAAEELGIRAQALKPVAMSVYSDENFPGIKAAYQAEVQHMFGIFECAPDDTWQFVPNEEVESIYPETLEAIVTQMHAKPGRFTPGLINSMATVIEAKNLPFNLDVDYCRNNWGSTHGT